MLENPIRTTFVQAIAVLEQSGIVYALVGGFARSVWASPRATKDVDFAVECEPSRIVELANRLQESGFRVRMTTADHSFWISESGIHLDLILAQTAFEADVLARRRRVRFGAQDVWVASPEDLIVYKLVAGRPKDIDDIIEVMATHWDELDWPYIEEWADAWAEMDYPTVQRLGSTREAARAARPPRP